MNELEKLVYKCIYNILIAHILFFILLSFVVKLFPQHSFTVSKNPVESPYSTYNTKPSKHYLYRLK